MWMAFCRSTALDIPRVVSLFLLLLLFHPAALTGTDAGLSGRKLGAVPGPKSLQQLQWGSLLGLKTSGFPRTENERVSSDLKRAGLLGPKTSESPRTSNERAVPMPEREVFFFMMLGVSPGTLNQRVSQDLKLVANVSYIDFGVQVCAISFSCTCNVEPRNCGSIDPWNRETVEPWKEQWNRGSVETFKHEILEP